MIKRHILFLSCSILMSIVLSMGLDIHAKEPKDVIDIIEEQSGNNITIEIPDNLRELLLKPIGNKRESSAVKTGAAKTTGYRIQIFSDGRNQNSLEARARARGNAVVSKFPKYKGQVYTFSKSPNWYTRIGNFKSTAEANNALSELKKAFPQFASEMRVVKSQIYIINQ